MIEDGYVSIEECATRMNLSVDEVLDMIECRVLRAYRFGGWGEVLVEPAIVSGAVAAKRRRKVKP